MPSNSEIAKFVNFLKDTSNFSSVTNDSLTTEVDVRILNRLKGLQKLIDTLDKSEDFTIHELHLLKINTELNKLLDDISDDFSKSEGNGLVLSPQQAQVLQHTTELTINLQGYLAIMNDTENVINVNWERMKKAELLKDLDIDTLENVYKKMDSDLNDESKILRKFHSSTTFDDIIGIDDIKYKLKDNLETSDKLKHDKAFDTYVFICLAGPPGTGKTSISHAIATEHSDGFYYNLDTEFFNSPYIGETEKKINKLFNSVKKSSVPVTIIIDEMDNILSTSENSNFRSHMQSVKIALQTQIDDIGNLKRNVVIVGLTNYFNLIDPIMHRRITLTAYVPPPSIPDLLYYYEYLVSKNTNGTYFELDKNYKQQIQKNIFENDCNGKLHFTNANIKQIYKNALIESLKTTLICVCITANERIIACVFGEKSTFNINANQRGYEQTFNNDKEMFNDYVEKSKIYQCFIVPTIKSLINATEYTNVMTDEAFKEFEKFNKRDNRKRCNNNKQTAVAKRNK